MTKRKPIIAIAVIFAVITAVLSLQIFKRPIFRITSEFYHPFLAPASNAENDSLRKTLLLKSKPELADELLKLHDLNEEKKAELLLLQRIKNEKSDLEELWKMQPVLGYRPIRAEIFLRDPVFWYESFSVNKGSADGVKPGSIVLCRTPETVNNKHLFAVVGRVKAVSGISEHKSQIKTIVSHSCKLSVIIDDSKAAGILEGGTIKNAKPSVKIAYLPTFKIYNDGAEVFTSGLCRETNSKNQSDQHSTPGGLFVGTISGRAKIVNKLNATAKLNPAVDFDSLRYVIILVKDDEFIKTR